MYDAMIEVRAFKERTAAARWLEVPSRPLNVLRKWTEQHAANISLTTNNNQ
jgi:hypothetical protein